MQVKEIMTRDVQTIPPHATLQEAAKIMKDLDVGPLPVCDGRRLLGMITDRDISIRAVAEGEDVLDARVRDFMTKDVVYCFDDQELDDALDLMKAKAVRRVLVLDREKRLVGIVSLGDIERLRGESVHARDERRLSRAKLVSASPFGAKQPRPFRRPQTGKEGVLAVVLAVLFGAGLLAFMVILGAEVLIAVLVTVALLAALGLFNYLVWGRQAEADTKGEALAAKEEEHFHELAER